MANVLIVDDDKMICELLATVVKSSGHQASFCLCLKEALDQLKLTNFDLVFLDVQLPDGNGLEVLPAIKASALAPEVIIITGEGNEDGAELALKNGCWDYIEKPLAIKDLTLLIQQVLKYRKEKKSYRTPVALNLEGIVGHSPQIQKCYDLIAKAANTDANVLVAGQTGTGKELFARAIHKNSKRSSQPFIVVDCAALPETLFESLLFGHKKGAFTGADKSHPGLIKMADKGTLFLDEIGELPPKIQSSFLRVLQEQTFRPLGDTQESKSDFRLVAATNRNLTNMVDSGEFRSDLLFRMKSLVIEIPPLKNRGKDLVELAFHAMNQFCVKNNIGLKGFSPDFIESLFEYEWPGNVREFIHAVERSVSMAQTEGTLYTIHLPVSIRTALTRAKFGKSGTLDKANSQLKNNRPFPDLKSVIEETEQQYFKDLVAHTGGDIQKVRQISGLSKSNIYNRLKKYSLTRHY